MAVTGGPQSKNKKKTKKKSRNIERCDSSVTASVRDVGTKITRTITRKKIKMHLKYDLWF